MLYETSFIGNIWANVQHGETPARLKWNFSSSNGSDWRPLFGKGFANPGLASVQPDHLSMARSDMRAAKALKDRVGKDVERLPHDPKKKAVRKNNHNELSGNRSRSLLLFAKAFNNYFCITGKRSAEETPAWPGGVTWRSFHSQQSVKPPL